MVFLLDIAGARNKHFAASAITSAKLCTPPIKV
jgi:hypothetical protein